MSAVEVGRQSEVCRDGFAEGRSMAAPTGSGFLHGVAGTVVGRLRVGLVSGSERERSVLSFSWDARGLCS